MNPEWDPDGLVMFAERSPEDVSRIDWLLGTLPPLITLEADGLLEVQAGDLLRVHTKSTEQLPDGSVRVTLGVKVE